MFAIAADYLMGWAMASADGARKQRAEWPPHPDRVFMAMSAAWFETGCEPAEGAALRWLEALPPPALCASGHYPRSLVTHYVPVNDAGQSSSKVVVALAEAATLALDKAKDAGLSQLPEYRSRQPRSFPVAVPFDPLVHLCWPVDLPGPHRAALQALCAKVTVIGHSASVVRLWVADDPPPATWLPGDGPQAIRLRVSNAGRLDDLAQRMNRQAVLAHAEMMQAVAAAKGQARQKLQQRLVQCFPVPPVSLRPEPGLWQAYQAVRPGVAEPTDIDRTLFDERLLVLAISGQRLGLASTLQLTAALRGAMMAGCAQPLPAWLSGHAADGAALHGPHVALLPLAFTGSAHADGRIMGLALALPRGVDAAQAARVLQPWLRQADTGLPREFRVYNAGALDCLACLDTRERPPQALEPATWTGPARRWASVTPVVLDRHGSGRDARAQAESAVAEACERIGLPRPNSVTLLPISPLTGVPPSRSFAPIVRKRDGGRMAHTHVVLGFDRPVLGPVTLGAGRFRGYGLCKPMADEGGRHD